VQKCQLNQVECLERDLLQKLRVSRRQETRRNEFELCARFPLFRKRAHHVFTIANFQQVFRVLRVFGLRRLENVDNQLTDIAIDERLVLRMIYFVNLIKR
jgi:hypothetical protein